MITRKDEIVSDEEIVCKNVFSQSRGLMFRRRNNLVMEFSKNRSVGLHMWFVFYPIEVLVLDHSMKVVEIKRNFRPWKLWKSSKKGKYVVELSSIGCQVKVGDRLQFRN
tara:strand:- start:117 stop:443 length:327 start_codon:yes stop_codon:yes gene_type:complete